MTCVNPNNPVIKSKHAFNRRRMLGISSTFPIERVKARQTFSSLPISIYTCTHTHKGREENVYI